MRGLVYHGERDVRYEENVKPVQINHPDEILLDVYYCGICGTDLKEYTSPPNFFDRNGQPNKLTGLKPPLCMGHEIVGVVAEIGPNVKKVRIGDHVVVDPSIHCEDRVRFIDSPFNNRHHKRKHHYDTNGKCIQCRKGLTNICVDSSLCGLGGQHGGLAEQMVTTESHAIVVPKEIPLEIAALTQPLAVSYHAVRISKFLHGSSALVIGGGAIGLATILSCFGFRASTVVCSEPSRIRRENAGRLGAIMFNPMDYDAEKVDDALRKLSPHGHGFDYTFDCCGFEETFLTAINTATSNGTVVNVAIWGSKPINFWPMSITKHEKKLMGSMCYTTEDFEGVIECFRRGHIEIESARQLITTVTDLKHGLKEGFDRLLKDKGAEIKILITPNNHGELENARSFCKVRAHI